MKINFTSCFLNFAIGILLLSSLSYSNLFIYKSLTAFFLYSFSLPALLALCAFMFLCVEHIRMVISMPLLYLLIWIIYLVVHAIFFSATTSTFYHYLIISGVTILALSQAFKINRVSLHSIYRLVALVALLECMICILQYIKLLPSLNHNFPVTGTSENPNVTAMFIAMAAPCIYTFFKDANRFFRKAGPLMILLLITALFLLQCRTALVGVIIGFFFMVNHKYELWNKLSTKKNRSAAILLIIALSGILIPITNYAYHAKQASADGRKLIWKVATGMIIEKPLLGYGYGSFERNYNIFQARYFEQVNGTTTEIRNAAFVKMGYNEIVQNVAEGGVIGFMLLGCFLASLVFNRTVDHKVTAVKNNLPDDSNITIARAGIWILLVMSLLNFTLQAIPVMCLLVIYSSVLGSLLPAIKIQLKSQTIPSVKPSATIKWFVVGSLSLIAVVFAFNIVLQFKDSMKNKEAVLIRQAGDCEQAIRILSPLSASLGNYESYWVNYANALMQGKDYKNAIVKLKEAKRLTSNPLVFMQSALCYKNIGDYPNAYKDLMTAANIEPGRIAPKVTLMRLCMLMKDTVQAARQAQYILKMEPKVNTEQANLLKYQAQVLLQQLGRKYQQTIEKSMSLHTQLILPNKAI